MTRTFSRNLLGATALGSTAPSRAAFAGTALAAGLTALFGTAAYGQSTTLPDLTVTATRLDSGITGASTSIITADDIARSPEPTIPGILAREPGVQVRSLFGGVNGANAIVDLRGFGATGASNTLVLVNGRRLNDLDLQGVDWAAIPRDSIARIEITRGNSGAVLYGDGAVGGVINIVTKTGVGLPSRLRVDTAVGSYGQVEGNYSANLASGPHALSVFANGVRADGYRANNDYRQLNAVGNYNYATEWGGLYANFSADDQHLGLPGGRTVDPSLGINQLVTDRRGTNTPFDYADKQGLNGTAGVTVNLMPGAELIIDGGVRHKEQQGGFFTTVNVPTYFYEAALTTASVTPRLKVDTTVAGLPYKSISGVDYYDSTYASPRGQFSGAAPVHRYDLDQSSLAAYTMNTLTLFGSTDVSAGGRVQRTAIRARDRFDASAPGGAYDSAATPLDDAATNTAWHVGLEHRLNSMITLFGRAAQSFRVPTVDERLSLSAYPSDFNLKTQTSHDAEAGVRAHVGIFDMQWSLYDMYLENEIHYRPDIFANVNLDPTRRYGSEAMASAQVTETIRLKAGVAYTRSVFREGSYAGNDVPLVARNTASAGVAWNILDKRLVFNGDVRYVGSRRMDNDQANVQPMIPPVTLVDVRLGGELDRYFWSVSVQNLFNSEYFDYASASTFTLGRYSAYPQSGRTFLVRAGATF